jgi:enoyl-CoA hydratase
VNLMTYENILVSQKEGVGVVQFNRPKERNALNSALMAETLAALEAFDADPAVGCLLVTGNERVFAAGADIREMAGAGMVEMMRSPFIGYWDRLRGLRKPLVAAVSGYALGGGCELALACDLIIAGESARFGQPEINLGVIPGAGGTQRMARAVGKALAMDICLTGRLLSADEALHYGLVSRIVPTEGYLEAAIAFAAGIAARAPLALHAAKAAVNAAFEMSLADGVAYERALFYALFATEDQREGMDAFLNKRPPAWKGR